VVRKWRMAVLKWQLLCYRHLEVILVIGFHDRISSQKNPRNVNSFRRYSLSHLGRSVQVCLVPCLRSVIRSTRPHKASEDSSVGSMCFFRIYQRAGARSTSQEVSCFGVDRSLHTDGREQPHRHDRGLCTREWQRIWQTLDVMKQFS
jgi:hypothetical protein